MADGRTRYAVEVSSLRDFLAFIDRELTTSLEPGRDGIGSDLPHGSHWGSTVHGGQIRAARVAYLDAQYNARSNLTGYLRAGATMREVIQYLMEMYQTTEELAALTTEDVLQIFHAIVAEHESEPNIPRTI